MSSKANEKGVADQEKLIDQDQEEPEQQLAIKVKRSYHAISLVITLAIFTLAIINYLCFFSSTKYNGFCKSSDGDLDTILVVALVVSFILYWVECCQSASNEYLAHDMELMEYEGFIRGLKHARPQIGVKIECYHYTKPEGGLEYYTDSEGRQKTRPKKYEDRVLTFASTNYFNYASCEDDTGEITGVLDNGKNLVKLQVDKYYSFDDAESQNKFIAFKENFIEKYRKKDEYIDDVTIFEIPGHLPHVMVHSKGYQEPACLSVNWFWVCSFFLISWPYGFWFELLAVRNIITLRKLIHKKKLRMLFC